MPPAPEANPRKLATAFGAAAVSSSKRSRPSGPVPPSDSRRYACGRAVWASRRAAASCSRSAATPKGVSPLASFTLAASAPCSKSSSTSAARSLAAALCSAVLPPWFTARTSVPARESSHVAASRWPPAAAQCSAEWPDDELPCSRHAASSAGASLAAISACMAGRSPERLAASHVGASSGGAIARREGAQKRTISLLGKKLLATCHPFCHARPEPPSATTCKPGGREGLAGPGRHRRALSAQRHSLRPRPRRRRPRRARRRPTPKVRAAIKQTNEQRLQLPDKCSRVPI